MLGGGSVANMGFVLVCRGDYGVYACIINVTCKNVMSRRIVMVTRGVMYDIGQSAPRGSPLIGAEPRGFPPRQESLVAWGATAVGESVIFGPQNEKY